MTKSTNTASEPKKQPPVDHKKASELTVKILSRMEMCCRYADIAHMNSEIFDNKGYILAVESFLDHARDISKILKDLQRVRGDRKSTRLNSSHIPLSRMPSSA